jgi:hypothetical protein
LRSIGHGGISLRLSSRVSRGPRGARPTLDSLNGNLLNNGTPALQANPQPRPSIDSTSSGVGVALPRATDAGLDSGSKSAMAFAGWHARVFASMECRRGHAGRGHSADTVPPRLSMLTLRVSMAPVAIARARLFGGREVEAAHRLVGSAGLNRVVYLRVAYTRKERVGRRSSLESTKFGTSNHNLSQIPDVKPELELIYC